MRTERDVFGKHDSDGESDAIGRNPTKRTNRAGPEESRPGIANSKWQIGYDKQVILFGNSLIRQAGWPRKKLQKPGQNRQKGKCEWAGTVLAQGRVSSFNACIAMNEFCGPAAAVNRV